MTENKRRGPTKRMTEWIRLVATPADKVMLSRIAEHNGDESESATVRRLIRREYSAITNTAQPQVEAAG